MTQAKTGGRQAGTPNKLTFHTRQILVNALSDELESLPDLLGELAPQQRIDAICKLMKYVLPEVKGVQALYAEKFSHKQQDDRLAEIEHENARDRINRF